MIEYDSIRDGRIFECINPVQVTGEMIANFCAAIGETNPLYTDLEAARAGPHGALVAHRRAPRSSAMVKISSNITPNSIRTV